MIRLYDEIPHLENEYVELRKLEEKDAEALGEMTRSTRVYRYLPTFLFEKQYEDPREVIRLLYGDFFHTKQSLILGVFDKAGGDFCGLAEYYGLKQDIQKTCLGYRLAEQFWGRGIATQTVKLMVDYLYTKTDTEIITASTMIENKASARVLEKNGFIQTGSSVPEDWGYEQPTLADKWFR